MEFVEETDLSDVWRAFNPDIKRYTYHRPITENTSTQTAIASRLDYFLMSEIAFAYCEDAEIGYSIKSDHSPVYVELYINRNEKGPGSFRFPSFLCEDDKFKELLIKDINCFIEVNINTVTEDNRPNPALLWDTLKALIRGRTIKYLATIKKEKYKDLRSLEDTVSEQTCLLDGMTEIDKNFKEVSQMVSNKHILMEKYALLDKNNKSHRIDRAMVYGNISSAYFFAKIKGIPGAIRTLTTNNNELLTSDEQILEHCRIFYDNLYSTYNEPSFKLSTFSDLCYANPLLDEEVNTLMETITKEELQLALQKMKKNSAPGFDGFTVPFYLTFWDHISDFIYNSINHAYNTGHFTLDQRRGVIKMLPKHNKNPTKVANLRPITLLCVEHKILTKALTLRLKEILPRLIHMDQNGFVANHFLGSNVIDVQTLLNTLDKEGSYAIISLDITKAFDTVDWLFLNTTLQAYGFPEYFLQWIQITHHNAELRVLNNGHLSEPFFAQKGLPQGDSLCAYLFILVIESLAAHICANQHLKGISVRGYEKKIGLVADDILLTLLPTAANSETLNLVLDHFGHISGLNVNYEKSKIMMKPGKQKEFLNDPNFKRYQVVSPAEGIFYLGVWMGSKLLQTRNFEYNETLMIDVLKSRLIRTLSLSGRILQVKCLAASKFVYRFMLLPSPTKKYLASLDKIYYDYIWDGRHKMSKEKMILPKNLGGFNMLNVYT